MSELNGVLPVDKPEGPTSHDIVARARRALGLRRIGHTGTLDPFASGLLLLCLGPATRLAEYLTRLPKRYRATLHLGVTTDTDDHTGTVLHVDDGRRTLSLEQVGIALQQQVGDILQIPPVYSAKKVAGERLYAAARRGEEVDRQAVPVTVHEILVHGFAPPEVDIEVECSSGTYIRAIARDVGAALGVGGHLSRLRRTQIGSHAIDSAIGLDALGDAAAVSTALISPADAVAHLPRMNVGDEELAALRHGRSIPGEGEGVVEHAALALVSGGELVAIGEVTGGVVRPRKVFT